MDRRSRSLFVAALAAVATAVVGVSVAWACVAPGFGTPSSPAAPSNDPPAPAPAETPGTTPAPAENAPAPAAPQESVAPTADSRTASGAVGEATAPSREPASQPAPTGGRNEAPTQAPAVSAPVPADTGDQFAARESGETAGVASEGDQQVFSSSKAPEGKKAQGPSKAGAGSPSEGSAVSDAWTGLGSAASPSGSTASTAASVGDEGSSGSSLGVAILALGLVGMLGALALAVAPRRRRVKASER